jgi:hypothetical protein
LTRRRIVDACHCYNWGNEDGTQNTKKGLEIFGEAKQKILLRVLVFTLPLYSVIRHLSIGLRNLRTRLVDFVAPKQPTVKPHLKQ